MEDQTNQSKTAASLTRTAQEGPVTLVLSVAPAQVTLTQRAMVALEVTAERGVTILEPSYQRDLRNSDHQFELGLVHAESRRAEPIDGGKLRWTYRFDLEFYLPGDFELPGATLSFLDVRTKSTAEDMKEVSLSTEPITIHVVADEQATLSPEELRKITRLDPIELPTPWSRRGWLAIPAILTVMFLFLWLIRRRRRDQDQAVVIISAHEWARRELARLIAENLIAAGRVQEFHYRISQIVRGYIERRYDLSAPEMTTEEFLSAAAADHRFGPDMTDELNRFLTACDLVKYARHQPGASASEAMLQAAGDFVKRTRARPEAYDGSATGDDHRSTSPMTERVA